jgi:hypothetical protein
MTGKGIIAGIGVCTLITAMTISARAKSTKAETRPTAESALAPDQALAKALRENDADAIPRYLSEDWAVIPPTAM